MNPEVKQQWLTGLRSGEFKQCKNRLNQGDEGMCCLGVLSEEGAKAGIAVKRPISFSSWPGFEYDSEGATLPWSVQKWAGLTAHINPPNPEVPTPDDARLRNEEGESMFGEMVTLAELNDAGFTFAEIADLIEQHL